MRNRLEEPSTDKTHYTWVYPLKTKDQVFDRFLEWKALVENSSGKRLKTLRSDNGGEYTSKRFETYLEYVMNIPFLRLLNKMGLQKD